MKDIKSQKYPGYLTYQLFVSDAFRDLKPASKDILILIYYEIKITSKTKRLKKYTPFITNRDDIKLPYLETEERLGYTQKTIWTAYKDIFAHGFLDVVKNGGGCKGDCKVYEISEKWREWMPGQIIFKIRVNGETGWQKNQKK